jgi:hypothetical protein
MMVVSDTFETCQLVLDRPRQGDPYALVYVAETTVAGATKPIATSPAFHPDLDLTAHRAALAALEEQLARDGWLRESTPTKALIGVRFHRWRA